MKKALIAIGFFVGIIVLAAITQVANSQTLTKDSLKSHLDQLISYTRETDLILTEYQKGSITTAYLKNQTSEINNNVMKYYSTVEIEEIQPNQIAKVKQLDPLLFSFSLDLKQIRQNADDHKKIKELQQDIKKISNKLQAERQSYE